MMDDEEILKCVATEGRHAFSLSLIHHLSFFFIFMIVLFARLLDFSNRINLINQLFFEEKIVSEPSNVLEINMQKLLAYYHLPNEEAVDTVIESITIIDDTPETIPSGPNKRKTCLFLYDCLHRKGKGGGEQVSFDNDMVADVWDHFGPEIFIDAFRNKETIHKTLARLLLNKDVKFSVKLLLDH